MTSKMIEIFSYLGSVAFVEFLGRQVKVDDVATTLAHATKVVGSWTIKHLADTNHFFISCPSREAIQSLMAMGHIRGEGFTLIINY